MTCTEVTADTAMPTTAVAPISAEKNTGPCDGIKQTAAMKNTLVKWITTGLMKVRVGA